MTRKGKIARLPHPIREQINQRLQNGEEGRQIADWLNTLPEVQAVMAADFESQPVNEPNLSHWKLGGYRDWEAQQEVLEAVRRFGADAVQLSQAIPALELHLAAPGAQLADQLALCLTARLALALQPPPDGEEGSAAQRERLRALCQDIALLRRGDHNAHRLRIESGKLDLNLKKHEDALAARKSKSMPVVRGPRPEGGFTKETIAQMERDLNLF
jgi:hypothetical protein